MSDSTLNSLWAVTHESFEKKPQAILNDGKYVTDTVSVPERDVFQKKLCKSASE